VLVATDAGSERFDEVVLACHSDQSLALLADAGADERAVLGAIRYHPNRAVLHTDAGGAAARRLAWAAWNYARAPRPAREQAAVCLHYLINRLQPLPWQQPVVVSLNPTRREPDPAPRDRRVRLQPPGVRPAAIAAQRGCRRSRAASARLVLRRLDALRLPRGRPDVGLAVPTACARSALAAGAGGRRCRRPAGRPHAAAACRCWASGRCATAGCGRRARLRLPDLLPAAADAQPARAAPPALRRNRFGLLSFHDRDHGDGRADAWPGWTNCWPREGVHDADGEVWLHTYPRVLGYAFKPVSFWYCHRADGSLAAIVAEVNNTFGERHCYLLAGPELAWGRELQARKVFHVSPFCRVQGSYRFRFMRTADAHRGARRPRRRRRPAAARPASAAACSR
jgi:hypothetical protein